MKVLYLLPSVPVPADSGARMRNAGILRLAARRHEVHALAFGTTLQGDRLAKLARKAHVLPQPADRTPTIRLRGTLASPLPDMAERLWSVELARTLNTWLATDRYDIVQAEGIEMARYLRAVPPGTRRVYDAHNAEFLLQRRAWETTDWTAGPSAAAAGAYSLAQWRRLEVFEREVVRSSDLTLAVSYHDANQLDALAGPPPKTVVVPNAVDVASYPHQVDRGESQTLLFLGKLDFRPNREGIAWLVRRVMPRVFVTLGGVRFFAVGASPPRWLVREGQRNDRLAVTGYVEQEQPYLDRAAMLVLPLRVGGGSRLKALVAFASGIPVLSTRIGMEGLDAVAGEHYAAAESEDEWAEAIVDLLQSPAERARLAVNARRLVEERYDWEQIRPTLDAAYDRLLS